MQSEAETQAESPLPGDPAGFARWVQPALLPMRRLAVRLAPHDDPQDVVQEALTRAWQRLETFDAERGSALTWLLAITADRARAARRTRHRRLRMVDDAAEVPDGVGSADERDLDLERAMTRLPPRQHLAVQLHYYVGLTVDDTAAVMACSPGTVKSTLYDARARLRQLLGDDDD